MLFYTPTKWTHLTHLTHLTQWNQWNHLNIFKSMSPMAFGVMGPTL